MKKKYILSAIASAASALLIISIAVMPKNTLPYSETEFSRQGTEPSSLSSRQESLSPVKESAPPTESKPRPESDLPSESSDTVETELKEPAAAETSEESENAEESAASVDLESTEETTSPSAIAGSENPPLSTETYTPVDYSQMKKYGTSAMMAVWPEDLKTLEEHAPIVFQGIPIESEDPILYYANSNFVMTGLTPTKLKVTKTFENSGDIEVGDVITILGQYRTEK